MACYGCAADGDSTLAISRGVAGNLQEGSTCGVLVARRISQVRGGTRSWPIQYLSPPDLLTDDGQEIDEGCFLLGIPCTLAGRHGAAMSPVRQEHDEAQEPEQARSGALD